MASKELTADDSRRTAERQEVLLNDPDFLRQVVGRLLQGMLEQEMSEFLGAGLYERAESRRGFRSGHRPRQLKTRLGRLDLRVPTERSGRFQTGLFAGYQRSEQAFLLALQEMYLQGVSTRKVRQVTEELCATPVSASSVSRLSRRLDEDLARWRNRRLTVAYPYVIVDARYEKVRQYDRVDSQGVLIIIGVSAHGQRDIIGVMVANTESETSWTEAFRDLIRRGLHGVRLVVSDEHTGLVAAIRRCLQGALWQRCQTHFLRNVLALVAKRDRQILRRDLRSVFDAATMEHARRRLGEVVADWRPRYPELADKLEAEAEEALTCLLFPASHRMRIRTTNMLERYNEEIRRRTKVIRIFPNAASCLRLITAHAQEQAAEWAGQLTYLDMTELETAPPAAPDPAH